MSLPLIPPHTSPPIWELLSALGAQQLVTNPPNTNQALPSGPNVLIGNILASDLATMS